MRPHPGGPAYKCPHCPKLTTHLTSIKDLDKGRADGCIYCTVVSTFFAQEEFPISGTCATWIPGVEFRLLFPHFDDPCKSWALYALNDHQLPWPQFPTKEEEATLPDFDPSSKSSFNFLKNELANCLTYHPRCRVADSFTPTRLLWLVDALTFQITKLPQTSAVNYIAVSYCWGKDQTLKLNAANKERLEQGLPISSLPVVFRDSIEVARKIGVHYLWIDSLCILQDSAVDWVAESAVMPQIYKNAYLTIAASSSSSTSESYLSPDPVKTADLFKPFKFMVRNSQGEDIRLGAIPENKISRHMWPISKHPPEPLLKRGWALQERLLSTRLISFGVGELEYRCTTTTSCECAAGTATNEYSDERGLNISAYAVDSREQALLFWYTQLSKYSQRILTYGRDKFPAISGVARALAAKIGSRYLAGIWDGDLARGLAWFRLENPALFDLSTEGVYRAPTWSWATANGMVGHLHFRCHHVSLLKAPECAATAKDGDPYGEIRDGKIRVHGALFRVTLFYDNGFCWRVETPPPEPHITHMVEVWLDGMLDVRSVLSSSGSSGKKAIRSTEAYNYEALKSRVGETPYAYVLPLAYVTIARHSGTIHGAYNLLVLVESLTRPGCFERIGCSCMKGINKQLAGPIAKDSVNEEDTVTPWSDKDYTEITIV